MATQPNKRTPGKPEGAPRWTYVVAAIVSVVGAVWGVASYFLPKPGAGDKPAAAVQQSADAGGGTAINAAGNSRVSVGGNDPTPPSPTNASAPAVSASQSARAASGIAINADGTAQVNVKKQ